MRSLFRTKPLEQILEHAEGLAALKKTLRAVDLVAVGLGCIIGVGIFVLPGTEAARHSGPGIILSFALAAAACACAALCYAELAAMIPASGSAYTYGYATLGEIFGWVIGWDLVLEYMLGACLVSIGWSAYLVNLLDHVGLRLPRALVASPFADPAGVVNVPAIAIVFVLSALLIRGVKESARARPWQWWR